MADVERLKALLAHILQAPVFQPQIDGHFEIVKTFCNEAVQYVLDDYGYKDMDGLLADEMCAFLKVQESLEEAVADWIIVNSGIAQAAVNAGQVGVAAHPYVHHGHVAMIAPGRESYSGHWGCLCPIVANVGHSVGYMGANMAFPTHQSPPSYYLLKETQ